MSQPVLSMTPAERAQRAYEIREKAANAHRGMPPVTHENNGDEAAHLDGDGRPTYAGNYSKGLIHDDFGQVNRDAYQSLLDAVQGGTPELFDQIRLAPPPAAGASRKLTNPQAGLAFDLEGFDAWSLVQPPAPAFASAVAAAEMGELYWMSLLRDVNFTDFESAYSDPTSLVRQAADSLTDEFVEFNHPRDGAAGSRVTGRTLFRGTSWLTGAGPYLSQFLLRGNVDMKLGITERDGLIRYGTLFISQQQQTAAGVRKGMADIDAGIAGKGGDFRFDYMKTPSSWLAVQNGRPAGDPIIDTRRRFITTPRDLAHYVHYDALYEAYLNAAFILMSLQPEMTIPSSAPLAPLLPYVNSANQAGFGTFGGPHILSLVTEAATRALKAVWFQKWFVHRRLRPEEYGGRVHFTKTGQAPQPIHSSLLNSSVLPLIRDTIKKEAGITQDHYFLPQAFPEGSPTHPAYGAGHATVAGACVTILKAFFDGNTTIPNPVQPSADGLSLEPYTGPDAGQLSVTGELNKLAENIAIGRNMAGVHWRSDATESLLLGEQIGLGILRDQYRTYNEFRTAVPTYRQFIVGFRGNQIEIEPSPGT